MKEILLNYLVQAILGGASGYITNDYAINMLFKEYTPLKIGGVIKKTRQEFIDNISSMVENDIINKEKLHEILTGDSFKQEFENMTADFYENCLYEAVGSSSFGEIEDFDSTIKTWNNFAMSLIHEHMPDIYKVIINNININDFLTDAQREKIGSEIYCRLNDIAGNSQVIEHIVSSLLKNNEKRNLKSYINSNIYNTISSNAANIIAQTASTIDNDKIEELLSIVNIQGALNSSLDILRERKINEVLNLDKDTLNNLNEILLNYVNSDKGSEYLESLINSLFSYLKSSDKSIFQLLDVSFKNNLKEYLIDNIPQVTEKAVDWIKENYHSVEVLLEEAIDEVINESDGLKQKLLLTIKNSYYKDLSKKYNILDKIISYVQQVTEPEKLSENLSSKIIDILNNLTIKEIILEAEKNNITAESIKRFLVNYTNNNSETIILSFADTFSKTEIKRFIPHELINDELLVKLPGKFKELLDSITFKNFASKKLTAYMDKFMSKELNELISKENLQKLCQTIKNYADFEISSNETAIKKWISNEILSLAETQLSKGISENTATNLNNELSKTLVQSSEDLKNLNISYGLDKLNSIDKLTENSSQTLRSYAIKNTDAILSGFVKTIVTDNLNKLNDDELVSFANDFIGRELKPIMYFGGVLGIIAGILLAAFQSSPLDPAEVNIANMVVYGFVGYITNVFAINMIFKPYRENKFLSKIPFFRNFALGYIVKNQKSFAKNTAHFIDKSLLSKKSINELFEKYKDRIKYSFTKSIEDNDYKHLSSLLLNNKHSVVKGVYSFLKAKINEYKNKISVNIFNKINDIRMSGLITEKTAENLSKSLTSKLKSSNIENSIYNFISTENSLASKLPFNEAKKFIFNTEKNGLNNLHGILSDENKLYSFILKYEDTYKKYVNRNIKEVVSDEQFNKIADTAGDKLADFVLEKSSRQKITQKVSNLVNKSIDRNTDFEHLFNGKFKIYANSKVPKALEKLNEAILSSLKSSKGRVTLTVQSEIKSHLGFIEKGMYTLIGGDELMDELISKIISVKIPAFLDNKKYELQNMTYKLLEERFYKTKVEVLYTGLNNMQLDDMVDKYLSGDNSAKVQYKIKDITENLFLKVGGLNLSNVLKPFNMNNLESFLNTYDSEIRASCGEISLHLQDELLAEKLIGMTNIFFEDFSKISFKELFENISINDVKHAWNNLLEANTDCLEKAILKALDEIIINMDTGIGSFIDNDEILRSLEQYLISLVENKEFELTVKNHMSLIIDDAVSTNFNFIDLNTKKYFLDIFISSLIDSLKRNLNEILKSIEFDIIAQEEIEKMEPEKIHDMFNSFAGKYFTRLKLYGFWGLVFGINMYVGFTLTGLKVISEVFNKNDKGHNQ